MYFHILLCFCVFKSAFTKPCISRKFDEESVVCVCNETYCDTYEKVEPLKKGAFVKYTSSSAGLRLDRSEGKFEPQSSSLFSYEVRVSSFIEHQRIFGFGSHFTDATGELLNALPVGAQRHFLMSYWSDQGSEYSMARIPIAGTDFGPRYYTYMDKYEDGMQLFGFNLTKEDYKLKIPHILTAMNISYHPIRFIASAWTAPKWMKTKDDYIGGELKEEYYQAWADYHIKFLDSYKSYGIQFWAVTMGNEPTNAYITAVLPPLPSMGWNPISASKWLKQNLGPTIKNSKHYKTTKIFMHDDNRVTLPALQLICLDKEAIKFADGIATHWYSDPYSPNELLHLTRCPDKNDFILLMTEAAAGLYDFNNPVALGSWQRAEKYADSIITYMNYRYSGWMDWNQALDPDGGPNLTGAGIDSCIIINKTSEEFYKQPTFYAMAHFSKFVPPDSNRIESQNDGKLIGWFSKVRQVAFKRPDGGIVVVLVNYSDTYVDVDVKDETRGQVKLALNPKSITTVLYW